MAADILGSVGVALLPTAPEDHSPIQETVGWLHFGCATTFFAAVGLFALVLFSRGSDATLNRIYRTCGVVIFGSLVVIGLLVAVYGENATDGTRVFWLESAAVFAFGVSWIVKGADALRDARKSAAS